jgi:hypothetical protein
MSARSDAELKWRKAAGTAAAAVLALQEAERRLRDAEAERRSCRHLRVTRLDIVVGRARAAHESAFERYRVAMCAERDARDARDAAREQPIAPGGAP